MILNLAKTKLILIFAVMALVLSACGSGNGESTPAGTDNSSGVDSSEQPFLIAVIPAQNEGKLLKAMEKLGDHIEEALQRPVDIKVYPDYNGVVEAMNYGKVDMAYFGPLTYVIANEKSGAKAIITQLIDGEPFYFSYIITHKDSKWDSLDSLLEDAGKVNFAFGDPNSTSGSLIPEMELKERGVFEDINNHKFKQVQYTGSHDVTALSVQNKKVDAGAIDSAIFDALIETEKIDGDAFKVIWKSDKLFQYPWAVQESTDEKTIELLQQAFLAIDDPEILGPFNATGFTTATDEDYESIRQAAIKAGRIK